MAWRVVGHCGDWDMEGHEDQAICDSISIIFFYFGFNLQLYRCVRVPGWMSLVFCLYFPTNSWFSIGVSSCVEAVVPMLSYTPSGKFSNIIGRLHFVALHSQLLTPLVVQGKCTNMQLYFIILAFSVSCRQGSLRGFFCHFGFPPHSWLLLVCHA